MSRMKVFRILVADKEIAILASSFDEAVLIYSELRLAPRTCEICGAPAGVMSPTAWQAMGHTCDECKGALQ